MSGAGEDAREGLIPSDWTDLRRLTPARVGLGRSGSAVPTVHLLKFAMDHARARDAAHAAFDADALVADLEALGLAACVVASRTENRADYLRRPDRGRRLRPDCVAAVGALRGDYDIAFGIGDGLSAAAVRRRAPLFIESLLALTSDLRIGPAVVATGARVAIGDEIGSLLGARLVLMLIGERPGLSAPDSLGVYLTYDPRLGRRDHERNCLSNIREAGLSYEEAAARCAWLARQSLARALSGVALKDESAGAPPLMDGSAPSRAPDI